MSLIKWIALGALAALVLLFVFLPVVAWILVGLVVLILAVVLLVPVGADVAYIAGEFRLAARVDGFAVQLIPRKPPDPDKKPREKAGCKIYRVVHGDTLTKIANRNNTTVKKIMSVNPELTDPGFIVSGLYIYIPIGK